MIRTAAVFLAAMCAHAMAADTPVEFFEKQVRPVLSANCYSCHGPQQQFSSLRVDSREALLQGGNRGPVLIPGDAKLSLLAKAIRHDGVKMPAGGKLPAESPRLLRTHHQRALGVSAGP
jgi:hypothetical protein